VAYLTHSRYGRNGAEITINSNDEFYTGWGGNTVSESSTSYDETNVNLPNRYTGQYGLLASTTGNVTGIYDMSGGAYEYTATYNKSYSGSYFTSYGSSFASTGGTSDKYATAYSNTTSTANVGSVFANFYTDNKDVSHTGEAIHEVWRTGLTAWNSDYSDFVSSANPFLFRGGGCSYAAAAGTFYSHSSDGNHNAYAGFRICLAP